MTGRGKPGPKPTLRKPAMVRFALGGADLRRVDAYAKREGINRSEALRRAVSLLVKSPARDPAASNE